MKKFIKLALVMIILITFLPITQTTANNAAPINIQVPYTTAQVIHSIAEIPANAPNMVTLSIITGANSNFVWGQVEGDRYIMATLQAESLTNRTWHISYRPTHFTSHTINISANHAYIIDEQQTTSTFQVMLSAPFRFVPPTNPPPWLAPRPRPTPHPTGTVRPTSTPRPSNTHRPRPTNTPRPTTAPTPTPNPTPTPQLTVRILDAQAEMLNNEQIRVIVTTNASAEWVDVQIPGRPGRMNIPSPTNAASGEQHFVLEFSPMQGFAMLPIRVFAGERTNNTSDSGVITFLN